MAAAALASKEFNAAAAEGALAAEEHLPALRRAYERSLRAAGRRAAARFRQIEPVLAAAEPGAPGWVAPPPGQIIDAAELADDAERRTAKLHRQMLFSAASAPLGRFGIAFDIAAPASEAMLAAVGQRIQGGIAFAIEEQIANAVRDGYARGDSVAAVASAIQAATDEISKPRADMLARTDLNALANGGSLLAASASGAAATKTWLATEDERTRPTHADADGQTVGIDDTFDVGGEQAQYPGDPALSDEEAINCRCTVIYGEPLTASARQAQPADFAAWRDHAWEGSYLREAPLAQIASAHMRAAANNEAALLASSPDVSGLAMVALYPASAEAEAIALPGGHAPEKMHVTLVFLGEAEALNVGAVREALAAVAEQAPPLKGAVGGVGRFAHGPDGAPLIALPDVRGLSALREQVAAALQERGIESPSEHGWTPHLTLDYIEGEEWPPAECLGSPLSFSSVSLAIADERQDFALLGDPRAITSGGEMSTTLDNRNHGAGLVFGASGDTGLPLSERDRAWDAGAATGRVKNWASSDGSGDPDTIDYAKLGRAYFWRMPASAGGAKIGDFKLPFADIIGGKLTAVWRGVTAGAARLSQTEGVDKGAVQARMAAYYRKAASAYSDPSIKPPWASGAAQVDGEALAMLRLNLAEQGADDTFSDEELRTVLLTVQAAQSLAAEPHAYEGDGGLCRMCGYPMGAACHYDAEMSAAGDWLTAAADGGTPWEATLCVAGEPTVDSGMKRLLVEGGGSWLPLPLPLALLDDSPHADVTTQAPICGRIDQISWAGNVCQASGVFFDSSSDEKVAAAGSKAAALVGEMRRMGISVDLVDVEAELRAWSGSALEELDRANDPIGNGGGTGPELPPGAPGAVVVIEEPGEEQEYVMAFTRWVIAGATICPVQALTQATISLVASAFEGRAEWRSIAEFSVPALTAAAAGLAPLEPPRAWFDDPKLEGPTPIIVTDEGQVFGHLALWDSCHTGLPGCVPPPRSPSGYMSFHLGEVRCEGGERVAVGTLSFDIPHAGRRLDASRTVAHYDDTRTAGAHVRAGEDAWGIWLAGALNPRLSAEEARVLMAAPPSGDWRQVQAGQGRDLVGALAVNVPGFPVPRERSGLALAASAECEPCEEALARELAVLAASADGIEGLAALVAG